MRYLILGCLLIGSFFLNAQSEQLARNYMEQGSYEKALLVLNKIYKQQPNRLTFLFQIVAAHQQLKQYEQAEKLLTEKLNEFPQLPQLYAELGHNFELQEAKEKAEVQYQTAIQKMSDNVNFAGSLGMIFEKYNLLDLAIIVYEKAMQLNPNMNYDGKLAKIYGEQGKLEKMFGSYLAIIDTNSNYFDRAQHVFSQYINEDPLNEANSIFRKLLIRKIQQDPKLYYNQMLSWLFVQQKDFKKAFAQEKAIYKRSKDGIHGLNDLAEICIKEKAYSTATAILNYIIETPSGKDTKIDAHQKLLQLEVKQATPKAFAGIAEKYETLLEEYRIPEFTVPLQIDYAHFKAFHMDQKEPAIKFLKKLLKERINRFHDAKVRMELADILVLNEKFNEALIYYSQIQTRMKNTVIGQDARFRVARTSYYKGDFKWAKIQLDVLKASTSQLIANDAMELSLMIKDNAKEDTTETALKLFAKAELLAFQNKKQSAIDTFDAILKDHKGEKIEDETLFKQAKLLTEVQEFEKARVNYLKIIEFFQDDILIDDAYFALGDLYESYLDNPIKAQQNYEKIIFNYPDSIFYVESRKKYRLLRGDPIN